MSEQNNNTQLQERKPTASERFTASIMKQFEAEAGTPTSFTEYEKALAQHLFLKVDSTMKELEAKRGDNGKPPIVWENVNMRKLALDAVHRIQLGLDALIPAHIYPVPYLNGRTNQYDIDLRVGYRGELYYRMQSAMVKPLDVRLELVYDTDTFAPVMKDFANPVESYQFKINNPFQRGTVIGGFAYIMYEDPKRNKLILVGEDMFMKSRASAKSKDFWDKYPVEMRYKTLVHRAVSHIEMDPKKVNAPAFAAVENDSIESEIDRNANTGSEIILSDFADENPEQPEKGQPVIEQPAEPDAADPGF